VSGRPPAVDVFGPYRVYEELGKGGMATVHRAEKSGVEGFKKTVALKRMLPHVAANEEMVAAFVREARLASFLRHGNVAQTYELGKVGDIYFIAMELVEGRNLREVLRRLAQNRSSMPVPIAMNIVNQICDALDYAHNLCDHDGQRLGIIHRDVSPANIIVSDEGIVKLIDFGIAKASAQGMQTMSGTIKGKFGYMAPEYLAGRIDARADLFAVGVIAHELLTNRPLFSTGDDMQTLLRVREMQIEPPSRMNRLVPNEIDDIIMTALERDPDKRWQHATALRNAMTTVTRRLGLHVESTRVVQWLEKFDFDMSTEPLARKKSRAYIDEFEVGGESMVISVEEAPPNYDAVTNNAIASAVGALPATIPPPPGMHVAPPGMYGLQAPPGMPSGSQPPAELSTGSRNRAEYQAALAQYEQRQRMPSTSDFDVPTMPRAHPSDPSIPRTVTPPGGPAIPRTVTPSAVASMAQQGRSSGPARTLIGVSGQIPIPVAAPGSGPIPIQRPGSGPVSAQVTSPTSAQMPAAVRSSADMAATRSAELAAPVPSTKASGAGRAIAIMLFVLLLVGGGTAAAYFFL
jgi:serine/threonine protein kinase